MLFFLCWCCCYFHVGVHVSFSPTFYCHSFVVGVVVFLGVVMDVNIRHHLSMNGIHPQCSSIIFG